jgi:outer membrane protein TolC
MKVVRSLAVCALLMVAMASSVWAQSQTHVRKLEEFGIPSHQRPEQPLPQPQGFADHTVAGTLVLTMNDAIRLALMNNTQIRLDYQPVETAQDALHRSFAPFDPQFQGIFSDTRTTSPSATQLAGASVVKQLTQDFTANYSELFQTGTSFTPSFSYDKLSTNSSYYFFNPELFGTLSFTVTQPLLRNFGFFPNRAPIVIAQRNIRVAQSTFEAQVNALILTIVQDYWSVVADREAIRVARLSLDLAQKSYERDKKSLELGALPPLDIYRSESEVAQRKLFLVQYEYALTQAQDQFRHDIGADIDPATRVLDLNLTENPEPGSDLIVADFATTLERALVNRPELEVVRQNLANDDTNIRYAHNQLKPDLELSGQYASNSLAGVDYNYLAVPPVVVASTGLGTSLNQLFHFNNPTYGATLTLNLPIRNHNAEANLGDALVSRTNDRYAERSNKQQVTLDVTTAIHNLDASKLILASSRVARDLAQKTLDAQQRRYEIGGGDIYFVLEAQGELASVESYLVQAQVQYQDAVAQLEYATNDLLSHHNVQIGNPWKASGAGSTK